MVPAAEWQLYFCVPEFAEVYSDICLIAEKKYRPWDKL